METMPLSYPPFMTMNPFILMVYDSGPSIPGHLLVSSGILGAVRIATYPFVSPRIHNNIIRLHMGTFYSAAIPLLAYDIYKGLR